MLMPMHPDEDGRRRRRRGRQRERVAEVAMAEVAVAETAVAEMAVAEVTVAEVAVAEVAVADAFQKIRSDATGFAIDQLDQAALVVLVLHAVALRRHRRVVLAAELLRGVGVGTVSVGRGRVERLVAHTELIAHACAFCALRVWRTARSVADRQKFCEFVRDDVHTLCRGRHSGSAS